ncbi:unnamed protein product, partial [Ectocarpus sp. 4 AP-2014]
LRISGALPHHHRWSGWSWNRGRPVHQRCTFLLLRQYCVQAADFSVERFRHRQHSAERRPSGARGGARNDVW